MEEERECSKAFHFQKSTHHNLNITHLLEGHVSAMLEAD